jgi:hypothetical protein
LPEADSAYNGQLKVVDIDNWIIDVIEHHEEDIPPAPEEPGAETLSEGIDGITVIQQEQSPISQQPFQLSASPLTSGKPEQSRKARSIIEDQLAFDFAGL